LIFDEIQCGMGRTGTLWAYEQTGIKPDAITVAKALGGGLPIGALVAGERLADTFVPGDHGSTFAGGPVVAAGALAALQLTWQDSLLASVRERGERLSAGLHELPHVRSVRGRGLMLACELELPAPDVVRRALVRERLVLNATGPSTVRLLPPLIVTDAEPPAPGVARRARRRGALARHARGPRTARLAPPRSAAAPEHGGGAARGAAGESGEAAPAGSAAEQA